MGLMNKKVDTVTWDCAFCIIPFIIYSVTISKMIKKTYIRRKVMLCIDLHWEQIGNN